MAGSGFESTAIEKVHNNVDTYFQQNKEQVIETLEEYISNLTHFKELLIREDYDAIYEEMQSVNKIKGILNGMRKKTRTKN
jgi:prephenate dehydrogenase